MLATHYQYMKPGSDGLLHGTLQLRGEPGADYSRRTQIRLNTNPECKPVLQRMRNNSDVTATTKTQQTSRIDKQSKPYTVSRSSEPQFLVIEHVYKKNKRDDNNQMFTRHSIQGVNDIDCQNNMGDTSQSTYQESLIQFCFISYFNFYVKKNDVFSRGAVRMFTIHQLFGSLQLGNTRVTK